jgi:hypothetical protein
LPHDGRTGPTPTWPLGDIDDAEGQMWERVWRLPQAIEWERMRCEDLVALYVRAFVRASAVVDTKLLAEVRQLDAKIGLSPKAMRDLRWETDEPAPPQVDAPVETPKAETPKRVYVPKG